MTEEKLRTRPVRNWDFMVAGVTYEGRAQIVTEHAEEGAPVFLARDHANVFSRNAVEVRLENGLQIGFVPEQFAGQIAPLLDAGHPHKAHIKKIFAGRLAPIPIIIASAYRIDADHPDLARQDAVPGKPVVREPPPPVSPPTHHPPSKTAQRLTPTSRNSGCAVVSFLSLLIVVVALLL